jgi:hypothetical protein
MGTRSDDLLGDSVRETAERIEDAAEQFDHLGGYFAEPYDNKTRRVAQVWLYLKSNGSRVADHLFWEEGYTLATVAKVAGQQEIRLMLAERIANVLNAGLSVEDIQELVGALPEDLPSRQAPEGWFYWASGWDGHELGTVVCSHYFVHPDNDQCLMWVEDSHMSIDSCVEMGIDCRRSRENELAEVLDAKEES